MEIFDIVVRWPGSVHDSRIYANCRFSMRLQEGDLAGSGILLGDGGYAQTQIMFTPVPNPDTPEKQRYNRAQISTRNVIERVNGVLKRRFACLNRKLQNSLENSCHIIVA
ncbi:unnamed protein product [Plutella xylostella]|uniref:(diamondback moth) hypothetical protein n=2 Tax=Plutella xylostella TaxID=51655 RepID=A0A8S4DDA0_PLUXY|nr:unnamed protein product [Plutella xylostella]